MRISELDRKVKLIDMENIFDIHLDGDRGVYFFNLNSTIYLSNPQLQEYTVKHDMFWTTLSYMLYGTTRAWWVLMKVNGVDRDGIFNPVRSGSTVKYVSKDTITTIQGMMLNG